MFVITRLPPHAFYVLTSRPSFNGPQARGSVDMLDDTFATAGSVAASYYQQALALGVQVSHWFAPYIRGQI